MSDRLVCKIKPLLYLCLLLGCYHNGLHPSRRIRLLAKLYCFLVLVLLTFIYYSFIGLYSWYVTFLSYIEYASLILFSLLYKHNYILDYFKNIPRIDGIPNSEEFIFLNRVVNKFLPLVLIMEFIYLGVLYYIELGSDHKFGIIIALSNAVALQVSRLPIMLIFALFYFRVKIMRKTLETNGFDNTPRRRSQPQKYIEMYETLMDTLDKTTFYVNSTWFIFVSCTMSWIVCDFFIMFLSIQESISTIITPLIRLIPLYVIALQTIIISAILSDLSKDNLQKIMIAVVEKRMNSKNERERAGIQKLYQLMQTRPYKHKLAGVFPLELRSLLGIISYMITTIIAILQIRRLFF